MIQNLTVNGILTSIRKIQPYHLLHLQFENTLRGLGLPLYQMDDFITLHSHTCIFRSFESNPSEKNKILRNIEIYSDSFKISCVMFNAKW